MLPAGLEPRGITLHSGEEGPGDPCHTLRLWCNGAVTNSYFAEWLTQHKRCTDVYLLGEGGMGQVFHATEPDLAREDAVKFLLEGVGDEASTARFNNEMRALTKIGQHPGVVKLYSKDTTPQGDAAMFMEYVDGGTLAQAIRNRAETRTGFSMAEVVYYLRPIAAALDYMHHELSPGWVHRDLKPANVLLRRNPGSLAPAVLSDFGISIQEGQSRMTKIGHIVGTEKYAAPENNGQAYGDDDLSARADDYSLALIAFEMLTLHHLKDTMPRSEWWGTRRVPDLTSDAFAAFLEPGTARVAGQVHQVMDKALDSVPMRRFPKAMDFIDALERSAQVGSGEASASAATAEHAPAPQFQYAANPFHLNSAQRPAYHPQNVQYDGAVTPSGNAVSFAASPGAQSSPVKKDSTNALIIAITVVVIILIALVTWAIVA